MKYIKSLKYSDGGMFNHPKTTEDFKALQDQAIQCKKNNDIDGLFLTVWQLIPDLLETTEQPP